jgi:excisionase family DNA binding protein
MDTNDAEWMTVAEVAERFGVGAQAVRGWIDRGLLPAERRARPGTRGSPRVVVRRADVRPFAERYYLGRSRPAWLDEPSEG